VLLELLTNGQMSPNCNRPKLAGLLLTGRSAVCKIAQNSFILYHYYEFCFPYDIDQRYYRKTIHLRQSMRSLYYLCLLQIHLVKMAIGETYSRLQRAAAIG